MKYLISFLIVSLLFPGAKAQVPYDSITISRFLIRDDLLGKNWTDTLKAGKYKNYISGEKTVWKNPKKYLKEIPPLFSLLNGIEKNGYGDVAKCFIPRHSINYYQKGKIVRFLLVCFECDGLRTSNYVKRDYVKSVVTRENQMKELNKIFKSLL